MNLCRSLRAILAGCLAAVLVPAVPLAAEQDTTLTDVDG